MRCLHCKLIRTLVPYPLCKEIPLASESLKDGSRLTLGSRVSHPFHTKSLSSTSHTRLCVTTGYQRRVLTSVAWAASTNPVRARGTIHLARAKRSRRFQILLHPTPPCLIENRNEQNRGIVSDLSCVLNSSTLDRSLRSWCSVAWDTCYAR
jgi:hypothetical protein